MPVTRMTQRPSNVRSVPLLTDPGVGHYPEFSSFLTEGMCRREGGSASSTGRNTASMAWRRRRR